MIRRVTSSSKEQLAPSHCLILWVLCLWMVTVVSEGLLPPATLTQRKQILLQRYEPTICTATRYNNGQKNKLRFDCSESPSPKQLHYSLPVSTVFHRNRRIKNSKL